MQKRSIATGIVGIAVPILMVITQILFFIVEMIIINTRPPTTTQVIGIPVPHSLMNGFNAFSWVAFGLTFVMGLVILIMGIVSLAQMKTGKAAKPAGIIIIVFTTLIMLMGFAGTGFAIVGIVYMSMPNYYGGDLLLLTALPIAFRGVVAFIGLLTQVIFMIVFRQKTIPNQSSSL